MRLLWFTNRLMPAVSQRLKRPPAPSGYWMGSLLGALIGRTDVKLGVVTVSAGADEFRCEADGVDYFVVGCSRLAWRLPWREAVTKRLLRQCAGIAAAWRPDLVHVHGTESFYGLLGARGYVDCPVVVSVQGLLSEYRRRYFGGLSRMEIIRSQGLGELLRGSGILWDRRRLAADARRECEIITSSGHFIGRTLWDRAHVLSINPSAAYYHVGEVMRGCFYERRWDIGGIRRHSLMLSNARAPNNGVETLIAAAGLLRREFPDISVRLAGRPGRGYGHILHRCVGRCGMDGRVEFLGHIDADRLSRELCGSHAFALTSYIENSPNSLAEAMLLGMPCVAGYAGGVPSMVEDGRTGLLFRPGDRSVLAERIREVFRDDGLAAGLGSRARDEALVRHSPRHVVGQLLAAYREVIARERSLRAAA